MRLTHLLKRDVQLSHWNLGICPVSHQDVLDRRAVLHSFIHYFLQLHHTPSPESLVEGDNDLALG